MKRNKLVYFVILHWNNLSDILEFLCSVKKINYSNFKVIIINNDENDIPGFIVEQHANIKVINNKKNIGFAKGCNQGIVKAIEDKADYVLLINGDTIVDKNFLQPLLTYCSKYNKTVVSPEIYLYNSDQIDNFGGKLIFWIGISKLIKSKKSNSPDYLSGSCLLAKTEYFVDVGLFDENYFAYFEDVDWSLRARRKGYKLKIVQDSKIWHKSSTSTRTGKGWGPFKFFLLARNNIYFARKNFEGIKKLFWITAYLFIGSNLHLLLFCRSAKSLLSHLRGIGSGLFLNSPTKMI